MLYRKIAGFLIAPLVIPIVFILGSLISINKPTIQMLIGSSISYLVYAYIFTLVLGLPALLIMKRLNRLDLGDFLLVGLVLSFIPCLAFYMTLGVSNLAFYLQCVFSVIIAAFVFWLIAIKGVSKT